MKKMFVFLCVLFMFLTSCMVKQNITLQIDGSGVSNISAELHPVFTKYFNDLASGFSSSFDKNNPQYFNLEGIREGFRRNPELQIVSLETPEPDRLSIDFRIKDIAGAIKNQDQQVQNIISRSKTSDRETLRIYLDKKNLSSLLRMIPEAESPMAKMLLPPESAGMSEEEYLDHLAWALEDYADGGIENILRTSAVNLVIKTPRKILSQTGGTLKNESEINFTISVLRLFTLQKPVEFSVVY